jgi:Na+/melibiose symporter-like transporter
MTIGKRLLFFAGQAGVMLLARFFFQWILKYVDQKDAGSSALFVAASVGAVFLVARVLDGVLDPIVGSLSDRWVARGRERRKLLVYSFALAPVGLALAFAPSFDHSPVVRWALLGAGFVVFFFGYTAYAIPYWSLVDDYGTSDRERSILSNLLGAGILLSVAIVSVATPKLIGAFGYGRAAWILAIPAALLMVLPYFAKPSGLDPSSKNGAATHEGIGLGAMLGALRHRRFLAVLLLFSGSQMALTIISAAAPFVCERLLRGSDADVSKLMTPFLGSAIPCFALVPTFARRLGWERAMLVASVGLALVYLGVAFLGSDVAGTPMRTAMILFGCGGPMVAVLLGLESEAIANCAREAEGSKTSLYFGMFNLGVKALNGVATFLTSLLVTLSTDRPDLATTATRAMGVLAAALLFLGVGLYLALRERRQDG